VLDGRQRDERARHQMTENGNGTMAWLGGASGFDISPAKLGSSIGDVRKEQIYTARPNLAELP